MGSFMENRAVSCAKILRPLLFNVDERPLSAAKFEVLQAGELEQRILGAGHPIRVQVTPAGSFASSTVTV